MMMETKQKEKNKMKNVAMVIIIIMTIIITMMDPRPQEIGESSFPVPCLFGRRLSKDTLVGWALRLLVSLARVCHG